MKNSFYHDQKSVASYIEAAKAANGSGLIEHLKLHLAEGSSVLEIGSGPGTDWKLLNACYAVTGSDYSLAFLERLKKQNPQHTFLQLDAESLETDLKFDGIYSNKVLQHLDHPATVASIDRQAEVLTPHGIVCHSFWYGEGSETFKGIPVNYHNEASLEALFGSKFEILLLEKYKEFDLDDSILLIGRKK